MTTNVFCLKKNVLASDSRWSYRLDEAGSPAVAYVDDTGYDKIVLDEDTAFMFAGPGLVIDQWRTWVLSPNQVMLKRPAVAENFAICMTDLETGEILMEHGQKVTDTHCRTAGTGAKPAYECWSKNADAKRAVESAILEDVFSGGAVKFVHGSEALKGEKGAHNLQSTVPFDEIKAQFLKKGMVMYVSQKQEIPIGKAAQNDPRIQSLVNKVQGGQVSAEAPSGMDPVIWTPADESRLDAALAARAERRKARHG